MADQKRILYAGHYLDLAARDGWEYAARRHPVVVLVAWTPDDELLLVEQFRIPVNGRVIELPAGLVGDEPAAAGEKLFEAAQRELEEETGWRATSLREIMRCPTSPGTTDEQVVFVEAGALEQTGTGGGNDSEDIVVHRIARGEIDHWLAQRNAEGIAVDAKIFAALYWSHRPVRNFPG